jgi:ADP-ribosyl-[dinitrogen reductase] hydrolase
MAALCALEKIRSARDDAPRGRGNRATKRMPSESRKSVVTLADFVNQSASETPADLRLRYEGAMLGLAVGNLLGVPAEFRKKGELEHLHPEGLREINERLRTEPWDDDLAQAILIAEAAGEGADLHLDDLAKRLVRWHEENGSGIGMLTRQVLQALESGVPAADAARLAWEDSGRNSAGNGAVMRCAPVALRWRRDGEGLARNALTSSSITHHDPRCQWSTAVMVSAIAVTLSGGSVDLEDLADAANASGAPSECVAAIRVLPGTGIDQVPLDGADQGYTLKAMQVGLWCLSQDAGFDETVLRVVMQGGDADTNGAVAGATMGARLGVEAIPSRWLACVPQASYISSLADRLHILA